MTTAIEPDGAPSDASLSDSDSEADAAIGAATTATARSDAPLPARAFWMSIAGIASLGAGAVHAAAIGVHAEHQQAALAFTAVAALQLCWGGLALVRSGRFTAATGALLGAGGVAAWALAKTNGVWFVEGLDIAEPIQTADGLAAGLALASLIAVVVATRVSADARSHAPKLAMPAIATAFAMVSVFGMTTAGTHEHEHGDSVTAAGDGHDHANTETDAASGTPAAAHDDHAAGANDDHAAGAHDDHAASQPVPYDPSKPIDLGGVPGVTAQQQAEAEAIVRETLQGLPQWSDPAVAEAAGFRSIGDGLTGVEHYVHQGFMDNPTILDPNEPESLVYSTEGGKKKLVAAMYMLQTGTPLAEAPTTGGSLMQWHIHDNLCYNAAGHVAGITNKSGECPAGLVKPPNTPMIHVWITPHKCGPFAALEGLGAGQIAEGEDRLCDHAHGA